MTMNWNPKNAPKNSSAQVGPHHRGPAEDIQRRLVAPFDHDEHRHQRQPGGQRADGQTQPVAAVLKPDDAVGEQQHRGGGPGAAPA
ncbi:hypothetical protein [Actinomadura kijaniata]|uniref:hypothetical protein n=1 Tax=Actinomadura kijaniata TaxID=46161 RepID=UPI001FE18BDA|nr:hypothetical protein [Actinomadura kijaniata]